MNKEEFVTYLLNKRKEDKSKPLQISMVRTEYPDNLIHIRDTDENREIVRSILGDPVSLWDRSYIVVNVVDGTWYTDFTYRYLYCDQPKVIDVKELIPILTTR